MKKNIIAKLAFLLVALMLLPACGETYIEENQSEYTAQDVVPLVLGVTGPTSIYHTETWTYTPNYSRSGSTWSWSVADATLKSVSSDTRTATLEFASMPADGKAAITISETTSAGVKSPDKVVEIEVNPFTVLKIDGPAVALQTFTGTFNVAYTRPGTGWTWDWSSDDATLQSVSADTKTATFLFDQMPASGIAVIEVTETSPTGVTTPAKLIEVTVKQFCPLINGPNDLVGPWIGTDGMDLSGYFFDSEVVISNPTATTVDITGINFGWMSNIWGEEVIDGGTATLIINNDGTCEIEEQWYMQTLYDGSPYDYYIKGSGMYDNCGASPTLEIAYVLYYDDGYTLPVDWAGDFAFFYAKITLDNTKGTAAVKVVPQATQNIFPPKRKFN